MGAPAAFSVQISHADFDVRALQDSLPSPGVTGAVVAFTGYVREYSGDALLKTLEIEHYPGMTERSIEQIMAAAAAHWPLTAMRVWHRVGSLLPGDRIVWVGAAAAHREAAFQGCEYLMDYLKTDAPFWKKESGPQGSGWVMPREADHRRRARWQGQAPDAEQERE